MSSSTAEFEEYYRANTSEYRPNFPGRSRMRAFSRNQALLRVEVGLGVSGRSTSDGLPVFEPDEVLRDEVLRQECDERRIRAWRQAVGTTDAYPGASTPANSLVDMTQRDARVFTAIVIILFVVFGWGLALLLFSS